MSTKHPDVLAAPPAPMAALTLAEIHVAGWRLVARCRRCGLALRASVPALIKVHGPDAIWWGVQPRCPGLDCSDGRLIYSAQSINGGSWSSMAQPPSPSYVEAWKAKRTRVHRGRR